MPKSASFRLRYLTHRYDFKIYDRKSGTVVAAGETTSYGNLVENLARHISRNSSKSYNIKFCLPESEKKVSIFQSFELSKPDFLNSTT
jgi:hypothetical protein